MGGSPHAQRAVSPHGETTSPKKRRKVNHGRTRIISSLIVRIMRWHIHENSMCLLPAFGEPQLFSQPSITCFVARATRHPFFPPSLEQLCGLKTDCCDAAPMVAYDLRLGKNSHWIGTGSGTCRAPHLYDLTDLLDTPLYRSVHVLDASNAILATYAMTNHGSQRRPRRASRIP